MLSDYLTELESRGKAPATVAAYLSDLRDFEPTFAGLRRYVAGLAPYAPATVARKIASARSYCRWLGARDWERVLVAPTVAYRVPPALPADTVERLLGAIRGDDPIALRDRAMLGLLAQTGCRASELLAIDIGDVAASAVWIGGTSGREVPFDQPTWAALDAYRAHAWSRLGRGSPALFVNASRWRGDPRLSRQALWMILKGRAIDAGLPRISPADLRHAAARRIVAQATDVRDAQYLLGHASVNSTLAYRTAA